MFLFASNALNIVLTLVLVAIYVGLLVFVNKIINKRQDELKREIVWIYFVLLVILAGFVALALWFFNLDYQAEITKVWNSIQNGIESKIGAIVGTVIVIFLTMLIIKSIKALLRKISIKKASIKKRATTIIKLINSVVRYTVEIIALLIILSLWGVNVGPALAGLGILGLVIGLGAQKLIQDFISGFFIIFEHHFDVGDIVEINGFKGEVIDIGLKTTRVKNWKQDVKIFSNGSINELINYSIAQSIAIIEFGISYESDIQRTIDLLNQELPKFTETNPDVVETPVVLGVTDLAASSVNLRVIVRTLPEKQYGVERQVRQKIKEILDENGISIPFPQVTINYKDKK